MFDANGLNPVSDEVTLSAIDKNKEIEEILKILASIAGTFAQTTPEQKALQAAADALLFISVK